MRQIIFPDGLDAPLNNSIINIPFFIHLVMWTGMYTHMELLNHKHLLNLLKLEDLSNKIWPH